MVPDAPSNAPDNRHRTISNKKVRKFVGPELGADEVIEGVVEVGKIGALVATDRRLAVVHLGMVWTGTAGQRAISSYNWSDITGIVIHRQKTAFGGLDWAWIEIQTASTAPVAEPSDAADAPNVIRMHASILDEYQGDVEWILARQRGALAGTARSETQGMDPKESTAHTKLDALRQLGELRDSGVLTEDEFNRMKTEIIEGTAEPNG